LCPTNRYVDPDKMELKGEIELNKELCVKVKNDHAFTVDLKDGKHYVMDTQGANEAAKWVHHIQEMQQFINS